MKLVRNHLKTIAATVCVSFGAAYADPFVLSPEQEDWAYQNCIQNHTFEEAFKKNIQDGFIEEMWDDIDRYLLRIPAAFDKKLNSKMRVQINEACTKTWLSLIQGIYKAQFEERLPFWEYLMDFGESLTATREIPYPSWAPELKNKIDHLTVPDPSQYRWEELGLIATNSLDPYLDLKAPVRVDSKKGAEITKWLGQAGGVDISELMIKIASSWLPDEFEELAPEEDRKISKEFREAGSPHANVQWRDALVRAMVTPLKYTSADKAAVLGFLDKSIPFLSKGLPKSKQDHAPTMVDVVLRETSEVNLTMFEQIVHSLFGPIHLSYQALMNKDYKSEYEQHWEIWKEIFPKVVDHSVLQNFQSIYGHLDQLPQKMKHSYEHFSHSEKVSKALDTLTAFLNRPDSSVSPYARAFWDVKENELFRYAAYEADRYISIQKRSNQYFEESIEIAQLVLILYAGGRILSWAGKQVPRWLSLILRQLEKPFPGIKGIPAKVLFENPELRPILEFLRKYPNVKKGALHFAANQTFLELFTALHAWSFEQDHEGTGWLVFDDKQLGIFVFALGGALFVVRKAALATLLRLFTKRAKF